jgi:hypothetical protein
MNAGRSSGGLLDRTRAEDGEAEWSRFHATVVRRYYSFDSCRPGNREGRRNLLYLFENYVLDTERRELLHRGSGVGLCPAAEPTLAAAMAEALHAAGLPE